MKVRNGCSVLGLALAAGLTLLVLGCSSTIPTPTRTPNSTTEPAETMAGHDLYIDKGCSGCHGQNAEGSAIAPALAGHTEAQVKRQVRTPRFRMPAFSQDQVGDEELEAIAHYITSLESAGHAHVEVEPAELIATVEMHHWMALDALKAGSQDDAIHHVGHIIGLLDEGEHKHRMEAILVSLQAGESHDPEHDIEEMVAGRAAPDLTLVQLHLRQALVTLAVEDVADTQHHVEHFQKLASPEQIEESNAVLNLLNRGELRDAEHEIQELLEEERHED